MLVERKDTVREYSQQAIETPFTYLKRMILNDMNIVKVTYPTLRNNCIMTKRADPKCK